MTPEQLQHLSRKDLQDLAKTHGIKANKKTTDLILDLTQIYQHTPEDDTQSPCPDDMETQIEIHDVPACSEIQKDDLTLDDLDVGIYATFYTHDATHTGSVKRLNKKSLRILLDDGSEVTLQHADLTRIIPCQPRDACAEDEGPEAEAASYEHNTEAMEEAVEDLSGQETINQGNELLEVKEYVDSSKLSVQSALVVTRDVSVTDATAPGAGELPRNYSSLCID